MILPASVPRFFDLFPSQVYVLSLVMEDSVGIGIIDIIDIASSISFNQRTNVDGVG